jgi:putative oxidoreductase
MKAKITLGIRLLLGLAFTAAGLAGLLQLAPPPTDLPEPMMKFTEGMAASVYFMPFLKAVETLCGLLLISGYFVPLALVVLAPIVLHIFLVHAFLAPEGLPVALAIGAMTTYLSFFAEPYRGKIRALFAAR